MKLPYFGKIIDEQWWHGAQQDIGLMLITIDMRQSLLDGNAWFQAQNFAVTTPTCIKPKYILSYQDVFSGVYQHRRDNGSERVPPQPKPTPVVSSGPANAVALPKTRPKSSSQEVSHLKRQRVPSPSAPTSDKAKALEASFCLLYTSPSPRDGLLSRMPSSA